jgi:hypothetical protein
MNIKQKVTEYYENKYNSVVSLLKNKPSWAEPSAIISHAIHEMLGVAMFVQTLGVPYEELEIYEVYKTKLENLLKEI